MLSQEGEVIQIEIKVGYLRLYVQCLVRGICTSTESIRFRLVGVSLAIGLSIFKGILIPNYAFAIQSISNFETIVFPARCPSNLLPRLSTVDSPSIHCVTYERH